MRARPDLRDCVTGFLLVFLLVFVAGSLFAQTDTTAVPPTAPGAAIVLGLAGLSALVAQAIGTWLVNKWNAIGGWLESKSNEVKRLVAVMLTGALGLATNYVASLLTHSTSWLATLGLSIVAGVIVVVSTGTAITTAKAKMAVAQRLGTRGPVG